MYHHDVNAVLLILLAKEKKNHHSSGRAGVAIPLADLDGYAFPLPSRSSGNRSRNDDGTMLKKLIAYD
jgi:hypothetical protein